MLNWTVEVLLLNVKKVSGRATSVSLTCCLDADGCRWFAVEFFCVDAEQSELVGGSSRRRCPVIGRDVARDGRQRDPVADRPVLDVIAMDGRRRLGARVTP